MKRRTVHPPPHFATRRGELVAWAVLAILFAAAVVILLELTK